MKRVIPVLLMLVLSGLSDLAAQSQQYCSDVGFNPPLHVIQNTENCFLVGVGAIIRGRSWSITAYSTDTFVNYAERFLNFTGRGVCLRALNQSLLKCEPTWKLPTDVSTATTHRMRVITTNKYIEVRNQVPIPICLIEGQGEFFNLPIAKLPCDAPGGCGQLQVADVIRGLGTRAGGGEGCIPCGDPGQPMCVPQTPILVSIRGNRLQLTDWANGVDFDLDADGEPEHTSWTAPGSDDAFLVLDRDNNGTIDDGSELFGNNTPQPSSESPNGFLALAVFDGLEQGGNGDGYISAADEIYDELAFWVDRNHDGISQPNELKKLASTEVLAFNLNYRESRRQDQYGNQFRYIGTVLLDRESPGPRRKFAVDVVFLTTP